MVRLVVALVVFLSIPTSVLAQATPTPTPTIPPHLYDYKDLMLGDHGCEVSYNYPSIDQSLCVGPLTIQAFCDKVAWNKDLGLTPDRVWIRCVYRTFNLQSAFHLQSESQSAVRNKQATKTMSPDYWYLVDEAGTMMPRSTKPMLGSGFFVGTEEIGPMEIATAAVGFEVPLTFSLPLFLVLMHPEYEPAVVVIDELPES